MKSTVKKTISETAKPKSKSLEKIQDDAEIDLAMRIDQTAEDSSATPKIHNKYLREYHLVKHELMVAELATKRMWREKWLYYSGKSEKTVYDKKPLSIKIMKADVKMFIESDDEMAKLIMKTRMLDNKRSFLKRTLDEIARRSFHIKNVVETLKFQHGVV